MHRCVSLIHDFDCSFFVGELYVFTREIVVCGLPFAFNIMFILLDIEASVLIKYSVHVCGVYPQYLS